MKLFFLVSARDDRHVNEKIDELKNLGVPFLIVCGKRFNHPNVVYREPRGKFDAINFGLSFVPEGTDIVVLNDVDTKIHNFGNALHLLTDESADLVFTKVNVQQGAQLTFYLFLDSLRKRIPIAASGELMLIKYKFLKRIIPLRGCKAEDTYILFKVLESGGKVAFCEKCFVTTSRTVSANQEEAYKRRTVGGIYQALSMCRPPAIVRLFYMLLPFVSPLLLILGGKGFYWVKGIILGYVDYVRGDKTAYWPSINP